jgi:hypothetical protein
LWVATKAPWPPVDGGRQLQLLTLQALAAERGEVEVDLVAPLAGGQEEGVESALAAWCRPHLVDARPLPLPLAVIAGLLRWRPVTASRHGSRAVRREMAAVAGIGRPFDVAHAEQAQAMPQALASGLPVVLRAQNVESDLWRAAASGPLAPLLRWEARRLARWEGAMVRRAARAFALSALDAQRLSALAGGVTVEVLPAPFPGELPAGEPLPGEPAIALLVGHGWRPSEEGAERFLREGWPSVVARAPAARLHVFGGPPASGAGVAHHPAPVDAALAFPRGAALVVPLWTASGVRMKVLEAWARGLPVVATRAAAAGLEASEGEQLLLGDDPPALAAALLRLASEAGLRERLVDGGRRLLATRHRPDQTARALLAAYRDAAGSPAPPR